MWIESDQEGLSLVPGATLTLVGSVIDPEGLMDISTWALNESLFDYVLPYHTEHDMHELLQILRVNVRIVGEEYKNRPLSGEHLHKDLNIKLHYNSRGHGFSSTELRD